MASSTDPRRGEWQAARAHVARRHHPDRGGDVETYLAALADVDARFGQGRARSTEGEVAPTVVVAVRRRPWSWARRRLRRLGRATRRGRYFEL